MSLKYWIYLKFHGSVLFDSSATTF